MKKIILIIACFLITSKLVAQDCSQYVYMQKGKTIETTTYGYGGMVVSKTVHNVADVSSSNGTMIATVYDEDFDKNGKSRNKQTIYYKCTGGTFFMDINGSESNTLSIKIKQTYIAYPANMKVGDHFDDVSFQRDMTIRGQAIKADSKVTEKKVVALESITTPAGTWNCLKITYKMTTTFEGMNMPPQALDITQWYAPHFGVVQTQVGTSVTTKITAIH